MGIFGWSLPPGCRMSDIDPPEGPCGVCGKSVDDCICPECPQCGGVGDPKCYEQHGLTRTAEQIASLKEYEDAVAAEAAAMEPPWPDDDEDFEPPTVNNEVI